MEADEWVTLADAGRRAGLTTSKIERLIAAGVLAPTRIGPTRYVRPQAVDVMRDHAGDRRRRSR